jgi:hypothetical protein
MGNHLAGEIQRFPQGSLPKTAPRAYLDEKAPEL